MTMMMIAVMMISKMMLAMMNALLHLIVHRLMVIILLLYVCRADAALEAANFVPLTTGLSSNILNLLTTVICNNEQAFSTSYLVGMGPPLPILTSWSVSYSADNVNTKYYSTADEDDAKRALVGQEIHYAVSNDGLSTKWLQQMPDAALTPVIAYARRAGLQPAVTRRRRSLARA